MKKLLSIAVIVLGGCAVQQPTPKFELDKQANRAAIQSGRQVEIFYHADDYAVVDLGGSKSAGLLGILGPIGLLAGMTANVAHSLDSKARTVRRSEEFSKLIADNLPDQSINRDFARKVGDLLEQEGRQVKVTKVTRPGGNEDLALSMSEDLVPTEGYMQLLLRLSAGYGATSATDTYKPVTIIEYALKDADGKALMSRSFTRYYGESDKTFMTYAGLLGDYQGAREELSAKLNYWSEPLYTEIFRFSEPVAAK
ncbi:hypothetical protein AVE30378_01682 [Achromobacter veterisilvae]|uniref:Lipoprotein n=1 Tax=Achromobacter veterisilvae TaxID=2069367 RepID=A0A446CCF6_9BURK|nr:hypothetical protein [Achromobacter veterisilvae]SSW65519.1 hypothetical protein AVE30378_01682 [Achromobacter veterisilvae]